MSATKWHILQALSFIKFSPYSLKQILYLELRVGEKAESNFSNFFFLADPDQLQEKLEDLEIQLKTSDLEKQHLKVWIFNISNYSIINVLWKRLLKTMITVFEFVSKISGITLYTYSWPWHYRVHYIQLCLKLFIIEELPKNETK